MDRCAKKGDITQLQAGDLWWAGVYIVASTTFHFVMSLFNLGVLLLKVNRKDVDKTSYTTQ